MPDQAPRSMSEAEALRIADVMVQRRLSRESAYVNAEDATAQAAAEHAITDEVFREIHAKYGIDLTAE